jgi:lysophospholipase L1-like esterase
MNPTPPDCDTTATPASTVSPPVTETGLTRAFASTQAAARVEYWQQRQAEIDRQVSDTDRLSAVKLVFVGDSITDFWLLGDDPWTPGRLHGRRFWDESFGGADAHNRALNIGISGDRTEHLLFRMQPKSEGGLGQLDAPQLAPEFFVLMVGINNSYAPEQPVADSVFEGVLAVIRALRKRKPAARIILQSILPTSEPERDDGVVKPVNSRLVGLEREPEFAGAIVWLDLYLSFVDKLGRQLSHLFIDGLHPNEDGYRVWRDLLVPALKVARRS